MLLSEEQIKSNKEEFLKILRSINREGADIEGLIKKLESSDFFNAPASTKYHSNFEGGLCYHTLNVYRKIKKLVEAQWENFPIYSEDTLKIVALCHDLAKMDFYEPTTYNKKVYKEFGSKNDELGRFDWESEIGYKVKDFKDRYLFGSHGQNSERIASFYIPLSDEESASIIWHMGGADNFSCEDLSSLYNKYPLIVYLHMADYMITYLDERI